MKQRLMDILACPTCSGELTMAGTLDREELRDGELSCPRCHLTFQVRNGVCIFGIRTHDKTEKLQEMDGENKWVCTANDLRTHLDYARASAAQTLATLRNLVKRIGNRSRREIRVLDIGAGWGALQSWQFASEGFDVVATEISPEFLFAADKVVADRYFERVVADGTVLPFKDGAFDVILCKEFIHHLPDPTDILHELWRVSSPNALIAVQEPCLSVLVDKASQREKDPAVKMGITHYYYSYREYVTHLRRIATQVDIEAADFVKLNPKHHPVLARLQRTIWSVGKAISPRRALQFFLLLFGGEVSFVAVRAPNYKGTQSEPFDRGVVPIDLNRLEINGAQLTFYKKQLVPAAFDIFRERGYGDT